MRKTDKFFEVIYETNQKGWRTRWDVKATTRDQAIGWVARNVTSNTMTKDVWFKDKDCINITEQVHNGTYKREEPKEEVPNGAE